MEDKRAFLFGAVLVVVGVTLLIVYSGSPAMKDVVAHNQRCQNLKELGSNEYKECQSALDTFVELLLESQELNLNECKGDMTAVYCPVTVWYIVRHLVITSRSIIKQVNQINPQPVIKAENHQFDSILHHSPSARSKREVLKLKNLQKLYKEKCCTSAGAGLCPCCDCRSKDRKPGF